MRTLSILMRNTIKSFKWIINILDHHSITYKISGGFAARLYGVNRELADIDIEVANNDIIKVIDDVKEFVVWGPSRYQDSNWDLELLTLSYEGQEIDISGIEGKMFNQQTKQWENYFGDLSSVTLLGVFGKVIPVEPRQSLIVYKTKLGREVDLEDVKQLNKCI